jgi:hypothetical protein
LFDQKTIPVPSTAASSSFSGENATPEQPMKAPGPLAGAAIVATLTPLLKS